MRSFASWIRVDIHWVWGLSNPSLGSLDHCLHYHSIFGDMISLVALIWVGHHSLHLLISLICFPSSIFILVIPYLFISYIDTRLWFISLPISFAYYIDNLTIFFSLIFHHWHFHCLLSSSLAHEIILHITSYTWGYWVLELNFPSFFSPYFPKAYITVRLVRPHWGHEIRCYLR